MSNCASMRWRDCDEASSVMDGNRDADGATAGRLDLCPAGFASGLLSVAGLRGGDPPKGSAPNGSASVGAAPKGSWTLGISASVIVFVSRLGWPDGAFAFAGGGVAAGPSSASIGAVINKQIARWNRRRIDGSSASVTVVRCTIMSLDAGRFKFPGQLGQHVAGQNTVQRRFSGDAGGQVAREVQSALLCNDAQTTR